MLPFTDLLRISSPDHLHNLDANAFQNLPFHFYWKDKDGKYIGCNDTQAHFVGLENGSDLLGSRDDDLCWSLHAPILRLHDQEIMQSNAQKFLIEPATTRDGSPVFFFSYKTPLRERNNKVIGIIGASFILTRDHWYLLDNLQDSDPLARKNMQLPERQADCLYYLIKGLTIKETAKVLHLSPRTVENYLNVVKRKLNCKSRSELIAKGLQLSYIRHKL